MLSRVVTSFFSSFAKPLVKQHLTADQIRSYETDGYLVLKSIVPAPLCEDLVKWADEIQNLPETPGRLMKYFEVSKKNERLLCRVENILPYYEGIKELTCGLLTEISSELFGEPAVIYKEKINFKFPHGNGFNAHQDQPAFVSFNCPKHVTVLVPIDPNTRESGGLDFAKGKHRPITLMPQNTDGSLRTDVEARLNWVPVDAQPGDLIFFDSYVPHRSDVNLSKFTRRNMYLTYSPLSNGTNRDEYYARKRIAFPPECERDPNKSYADAEKIYNVANPIK